MKIGFIDYYLDEWHANHYPDMIREVSGGEMEVVCAYALIDGPDGRRTTAEWCAQMGIDRAESIEEVIERCDGLIVLSPDDCDMHEQLCQLPLRSGKPTYVDKTFAPDGATARRIFAIAQESATPCYSTSALRYASEYEGITGVEGIASWGPNGFETYAIHQLEPIMMLMQGRPARVMAMPGKGWYTMTIAFADGRTATLAGYDAGSPFMMNLTGRDGAKMIEAKSAYFNRFIEQLVAFFRDPRKIVPHEETIAIMDVRGAGIQALAKPGEWIEI